MTESPPVPERVAWRHRLVVRLFAGGALVAVIAIAAATLATVQLTTVAVRDAQQQSLGADARVYDTLLGYGSTHPDWRGALGTVRALADGSGARIAVTDLAGRVIVDSGDDRKKYDPTSARATLDPLAVDLSLIPAVRKRSAGDTKTAAPRPAASALKVCADNNPDCPRYEVRAAAGIDPRADARLDTAIGLGRLRSAVDRCLTARGMRPVASVASATTARVSYPDGHVNVARCLSDSRRSVLRGSVAPAALLFVTGGPSRVDVFWDLSPENRWRIALLAAAVLAMTLALCALLARRVVRPLRGMAAAARGAGAGDLDARVDYRRHDELGQVAHTFNVMADRRRQLELARRQLASDVSHELRTPLANVRAWLEGAQDGLVETDDRLVTSLYEETLHLQRLVDDLRDLAAGDAGELRIHTEVVDVTRFLEQVRASFHGAAESAGVVITCESRGDSVLTADPFRLRQAVDNLVANALRHTPSGGAITLVGSPSAIAVHDTGEGIPADELEHVFDRFRRVDRSRSRHTGGTGLGLAIVRQIMTAHGGTARLDSEPGVGSVATLRFDHPADRPR